MHRLGIATASEGLRRFLPRGPVPVERFIYLAPIAALVCHSHAVVREVALCEISRLKGEIGGAQCAMAEIGETVNDMVDLGPVSESAVEHAQTVQFVEHRDGEQPVTRTESAVPPAACEHAPPRLLARSTERVVHGFFFRHVHQVEIAREREPFGKIMADP